MATVWIPSLMRELTGGHAQVTVPGRTVGEVIDALEGAYPGVKARLCEGEQMDPALQAWVDGRVALLNLLEPVGEGSEVVFLPVAGGG